MAEVITVDEFRHRLRAQGVKGRDHFALKCPMCSTIQSATSLIRAGAGKDFDEVERFIGFSCVGRFTGAGSPRKEPDGQACNWTLGGLFRCHKLEVQTQDGEIHMRFEVATPEEAQALEALHA